MAPSTSNPGPNSYRIETEPTPKHQKFGLEKEVVLVGTGPDGKRETLTGDVDHIVNKMMEAMIGGDVMDRSDKMRVVREN